MTKTKKEYLSVVEGLGQVASDYLSGMEGTYEQFRLRELPEMQAQVKDRYEAALADKKAVLSGLQPPQGLADFHSQLLQAWEHLVKSREIFCHPIRPEEWILGLRGSRGQMCQAMRLLYGLRLQIPGFASHWVTPEARHRLKELETQADPHRGCNWGCSTVTGSRSHPATASMCRRTTPPPEAGRWWWPCMAAAATTTTLSGYI